MKNLGIIFESDVTFNLHISKMINKVLKQLGFIRCHCNKFTILSVLKSSYCSLVYSFLDYSSTFWFLCELSLIKKILAIQNRFLHLISMLF